MPLKTGYPCCPNGSHVLCRYAHFAYKPRYTCFHCRKAFKRSFQAEVDPTGEPHAPRCPECGGEVHDLGLGFSPPRRADLRQWRRLAALAAANVHFLCCGGARQPRNAVDHRELLTRRRARLRR